MCLYTQWAAVSAVQTNDLPCYIFLLPYSASNAIGCICAAVCGETCHMVILCSYLYSLHQLNCMQLHLFQPDSLELRGHLVMFQSTTLQGQAGLSQELCGTFRVDQLYVASSSYCNSELDKS